MARRAVLWLGCCAGALVHREARLPATRVSCVQSAACGEDCAAPLTCSEKHDCQSMIMTRTCTYRHLYFDSEGERQVGKRKERGRWLFYAPDGSEEPVQGAATPRPCLTLLRGYYHFSPEVVRALPPAGGGAGRDGGVQHVRRLTHVDQKFHGCFGHRFLEENFAMYWALAEAQRTWRVDARNVTLFFDGHLMHKFAGKMWAMVGKADGVPKDSFRHIFAALANASDHALHREHRRVREHRLTHFETVVVGGSGGRSPYNAGTYLKSIPLHVRQLAGSGRAPQPYDAEYALDEKAGAHSHYMSHLMRFFGFRGGRLGREKRPLAQRLVVVLNREKESNGRVIKNHQALLKALVAKFGAKRVHPRVESPNTLDMPAMIALLRNTRILVSPHGSQNSNAGFLPPGAALLEVQASGCQENRGYRVMSQLWGLHYVAVSTPGSKTCNFKSMISADVPGIVAAAAKLDVKITDHEQNRTAWVRETMALPPRQAGDRWEPVTECSPQ